MANKVLSNMYADYDPRVAKSNHVFNKNFNTDNVICWDLLLKKPQHILGSIFAFLFSQNNQ